jgi:two-component system nitrogen regulation sensor histidine kinase GlnL
MNATAWPAAPPGHEAFDLLATMVAVVRPDGRCLFANAAFENVLGLSRRSVLKRDWFGWFQESDLLRETVAAVAHNEF